VLTTINASAAEQTDEAHIVSVSANADGNSVVQLDRPLLFTHLGEIVDVPGDEYGRKVRACWLAPRPLAALLMGLS
jgi:hypothetical protein